MTQTNDWPKSYQHSLGNVKMAAIKIAEDNPEGVSKENLEEVKDNNQKINDSIKDVSDRARGIADQSRNYLDIPIGLSDFKSLVDKAGTENDKKTKANYEEIGKMLQPKNTEDAQPFGYKGRDFTVEMQKQVRGLTPRPVLPQEEVDAQYNGNPAWLDRSHLGSWNKRYAAEGFNPFHWGQVINNYGSDHLYWKLHVPLKSGVRYLSTHFRPNSYSGGNRSMSIALPNSDEGIIDRTDKSNKGIVDIGHDHNDPSRAHAEMLRAFILHHNGALRTADEYDRIQH